MHTDLIILLTAGGAGLLYTGLKKRINKEYFVHNSLVLWLLGILSLLTWLSDMTEFIGEELNQRHITLLLLVFVGLIGVVVWRGLADRNQRKINIHDMDKQDVMVILERLMVKYSLAYEKQLNFGGAMEYTFKDAGGKITIKPHTANRNHQVVTIEKIKKIPDGRELFEVLKNEITDFERPISNALGIYEIATGTVLLGVVLYFLL